MKRCAVAFGVSQLTPQLLKMFQISDLLEKRGSVHRVSFHCCFEGNEGKDLKESILEAHSVRPGGA